MTDPDRSACAHVHVGAPLGRRTLLKAATASLAACVGCARATLHAAVSAHLQQPGAAPGIVAYSGVCPHTGCDVSDWLNGPQTLLCPCHESEFDPAVNAR